MLPEFDDRGYLPPGVHRATFQELAERFGWQSEIRQVQIESLRWLVELVRKAGAERLIVNGSFVTDKLEPNDVDCLVLIQRGFPRETEAEAELLIGLPFLEIQVVTKSVFDVFAHEVFSFDRDSNAKGMVEVTL